MASPNKGNDTVPKGVAYTVIGVLVFLCVGVFGFVGWLVVQNLGDSQNQNRTVATTGSNASDAVEITADNVFDYLIFSSTFSDLRNTRSGLAGNTATATWTLDIQPAKNVEFNNAWIDIERSVGFNNWSFVYWGDIDMSRDFGEILDQQLLRRLIQIPFDGRTSISVTIYFQSMFDSPSLPQARGRGLSSFDIRYIGGTVTYP